MSFINFGLVPLEFRVTFMSTCAICWNFYLSSVVSKKAQPLKLRVLPNNSGRSPNALCDDIIKEEVDQEYSVDTNEAHVD
ncbi:unnamed protein product [Calypogeia fissa]